MKPTCRSAKSPLHAETAKMLGPVLFAAIGLLIASTLTSIFPGWTGGLVLAAAVLAAWLLAMVRVLRAIWCGARARWQRAGWNALAAMAMIVAIAPCCRAGDLLHLALFYPRYAAAIQAASQAGGVVRFDWGDSALWAPDGAELHTLVYDRSDAVKAFVDRRQESAIGGVLTRHLFGHFYRQDECTYC